MALGRAHAFLSTFMSSLLGMEGEYQVHAPAKAREHQWEDYRPSFLPVAAPAVWVSSLFGLVLFLSGFLSGVRSHIKMVKMFAPPFFCTSSTYTLSV